MSGVCETGVCWVSLRLEDEQRGKLIVVSVVFLRGKVGGEKLVMEK